MAPAPQPRFASIVTTPSDTEVCIERTFAAPRALVFRAWTDPALIPRWMGPARWKFVVCEVHLRPGGGYRFLMRDPEGHEMDLRGTYHEVEAPARLVATETWGGDWPTTRNTLTFEEVKGQTTVVLTTRFPDKAGRDAALGSGMGDGMEEGYARLDGLLGTMR